MKTVLRGMLSVVVGALFVAGSTARAVSIRLSPQGELLRAPEDYNIRLGEIHLSLSGKMAMEYNDNIDRASSSDDTNEGWAFKPSLSLGINWPVVPNYITVDANVGVSWTDYIRNKGEDQFSFTGGEGLSDGFVHADFLLTDLDTLSVYDKFSRDSQNLNIAARNYPSNYALLKNIFGLRYQHDFSELARLVAQAAHTTAHVNNSTYNYQDHASDAFNAVFAWRVNRYLEIGPYARWERYVYDTDEHNDSTAIEGGLAFLYEGPRSLTLEGCVGYEILDFVNENHQSASNDGEGGTFRLSATYLASERMQHILYGAYERYQGTLGPRVNFSRDLTVGYTIQVEPIQFWTFRGGVDWLNIHESDDTGEDANLVRFHIEATYQLSDKTAVSLSYRRTDKASQQDDREYRQNLVELALSHKF